MIEALFWTALLLAAIRGAAALEMWWILRCIEEGEDTK
jgi:hypothetical protein